MQPSCSPARARASAGAIIRPLLLALTGLACLLSVAIGSPDRAYPRQIATTAPATAASPAALIDDIQTDATGLLTSLRLGNGIRLQREHDPNGLLIAQTGSPSGAGPSLGFDASGNVLSRTLFGRTTHYAYDALDRLIAENGPAGSRSYTYDANGILEHEGGFTRALYLETDQLGSPIAATDAQQRLVWKWAGNERNFR